MAEPQNRADGLYAETAAAADVRPDSGAQAATPHALDLQPYSFVDDVINAVNDYLADGFDTLDASLLQKLPLNEQQADELQQATAALFERHRGELETWLAHFERTALDTGLRIPPGLTLEPAPAEPPETDGADQADEAALEAELAALRAGIAAARRGFSAGRAELRVLDRDLAAAGDPQELAAAANDAAGKENVAEDVAALVAGARRLQPLLAQAQHLRRAAKDAPQRREEIDVVALADRAILRHEQLAKVIAEPSA